MLTKDNELLEILKISASAVKSYDQCPRKYFFNYIQRAPKKHWAHFDLGNICHNTLEIFHEVYMKEGTEKRSLKQIMSYAFSVTRQNFKHVEDSMLLDAKDMLMDYLQFVKNNGMPLVKGVETPFEFNITEDIVIRGFIDRIDVMKDGRFRIVDYKTTKNVKYLDAFQLSVYGLWLQREYPNIDSFTGSYVLLRHGSKFKDYDFNIEDVEKTKKELIEYATNIREENEWTPIPTILCNWCDFKEICPAQQMQQSW